MTAVVGIGEMSPAAFAAHYIDVGVEAGVLIAPRLDEDRFVVVDGDTEHDLAPLYERYLAMPARSRRYFLLRAMRGGALTPHPVERPYAEVASRLLPRVRSAAFLECSLLDDANRGRPPQHIYAPLSGDLHVCVVVDGDDTMTAVTHMMLAHWDMSFEELRTQALRNLAAKDAEPLGMLSPGLWMGPWEDSYAASRIMMLDALRVCDAPIVAVPNRDTILVADRHNDAALGAMVSLIESVSDQPYPVSKRLYRLVGDTLFDWTLPSTHSASSRHRRLCMGERVRHYGDQAWLLQEAVGPDWYVATAEMDENSDGTLSSRALWTEGVRALLPEVDRLHLLTAMADGTSSRLMVAEFGDVCDLDGVLVKTDNLLPRWRTARFPTDQELRAIAMPVARHPGTTSVSSPGQR